MAIKTKVDINARSNTELRRFIKFNTSTVKYIATDLDGTLLSSDTNISKEILEAIERLSKKQISTILLTGRTLLFSCRYRKRNI